jgi:type II restriction enzyme
MPIVLSGSQQNTGAAVRHYWRTLEAQSRKQKTGSADRGGRAAVTGGKQMMGFCAVVRRVLVDNGVQDVHIFVNAKLELPGYFRPTKSWDMLVVSLGHLIAALEFKSQRGPSFGNNFNNRTEEAIGTAHDLWTAYREGAFGRNPRPWLGWVMLLEDCAKSTVPVKVAEPHFKVFPEFREASYATRYELLLRRLVREKLFDRAAFLMATDSEGRRGAYTEPAEDLGMQPFLASLAGHAMVVQAGQK